VAYQSGGIQELIRHGVDGILCERTAGSLADALRIVATDQQLREGLNEEGRQIYLERFTLERFQGQICDSLAEWIESSKRPATEMRDGARRARLLGGGRSV
jgi:glycosyltransferase involved in cell wall biosynthesis